MHSHAGLGPDIEQPSYHDLYQLNSSTDGYNYIINKNGLVEFHLPEQLPGGFTHLFEQQEAWTYWITQELKLTEDEYEKIGGWELKKQFYELYFGLRSIPWDDEEAIERILDKGSK